MPIEHVDDLRVYAQVVERGTLAAAGRSLDMSPTLVSRRLARLERAVGVRLVERTTRSLHVTHEGRAFYRRSRRILGELEVAERELRPVSTEVEGTVRIVLPTSMLAYGIMDALDDLLTTHPKLSVHVRVSDEATDVLDGGWDIATHFGVPDHTSHVGQLLGSISPVLAATPDYLAHSGTPEHPLDLSSHECIRAGSGALADEWPIVDTTGVTHRVPIGGRLTCHDVITLYTAMTAGLGIGLIPRAVLRRAQRAGLLDEVLPGCHLEGPTIYAVMPVGRHRLPRIRAVVEWLADFMQALDGAEAA